MVAKTRRLRAEQGGTEKSSSCQWHLSEPPSFPVTRLSRSRTALRQPAWGSAAVPTEPAGCRLHPCLRSGSASCRPHSALHRKPWFTCSRWKFTAKSAASAVLLSVSGRQAEVFSSLVSVAPGLLLHPRDQLLLQGLKAVGCGHEVPVLRATLS